MRTRVHAWIALAIAVAAVAFAAVVDPFGPPGSSITAMGLAWLGVALAAVLPIIHIASGGARSAGSRAWRIAVVMVWPLAFYYVLVVNRDPR